MGKRLILAGCLVLSACGSPWVAKVDLDSDIEYGFLAFLGANGEVLRATEVFWTQETDKISSSENLPSSHLDEGEESALLVTFGQQELQKRAPYYLDPRLPIESPWPLRFNSEECPAPEPVLVSLEAAPKVADSKSAREGRVDRRTTISLPGDTKVTPLPSTDFEGRQTELGSTDLSDVKDLQTAVHLKIYDDQGPCVVLDGLLSSFAPNARIPVEEPSFSGDLVGLEWVDSQRLLVGRWSGLALLTRNNSSYSSTITYSYPRPPPLEYDVTQSMYLDRSLEPPVVYMMGYRHTRTSSLAAVWAYEVHQDSLKPTWAAVAPEKGLKGRYVRSALRLPSGQLIFGGDAGTIYRYSSSQGFEAVVEVDNKVPSAFNPNKAGEQPVTHLHWVPPIEINESIQPGFLVATTKGRVHELDAQFKLRRPHYDLLQDGILHPERLRWSGIVSVLEPNQPAQLWVVGTRGYIFKQSQRGQAWQRVKPVYPENFLGCGSMANPMDPIEFFKPIRDVAVIDGHLVMGYNRCNAVISMRLVDEKVQLLPELLEVNKAGEKVARPISGQGLGLTRISVQDGRLAAAGSDGEVLVLE